MSSTSLTPEQNVVLAIIKKYKAISPLLMTYYVSLDQKTIEKTINELIEMRKVSLNPCGCPKRYSPYEQIVGNRKRYIVDDEY